MIEQLHVLIVQHIRNFECTKQGTCEVFGFCYFHIGYFHNEHYRSVDVELFVSIKQLPVKSDSKLTAKKLYSDTIQRSKDE